MRSTGRRHGPGDPATRRAGGGAQCARPHAQARGHRARPGRQVSRQSRARSLLPRGPPRAATTVTAASAAHRRRPAGRLRNGAGPITPVPCPTRAERLDARGPGQWKSSTAGLRSRAGAAGEIVFYPGKSPKHPWGQVSHDPPLGGASFQEPPPHLYRSRVHLPRCRSRCLRTWRVQVTAVAPGVGLRDGVRGHQQRREQRRKWGDPVFPSFTKFVREGGKGVFGHSGLRVVLPGLSRLGSSKNNFKFEK